MAAVNQVDEDGDGFVSNFDLRIRADTRLNGTDLGGADSGEPYFIIKINGEEVGKTGQVKRTANGVFTIELPKSTFKSYERGPLQVDVVLADQDPGKDDEIESWSTTVKYEPK